MEPIKAEPLSEDRMAAWLDGRIPRRLLAIPFGGPIPSAKHPGGVDLDDEWFTPRTDIKPDWLAFRVCDWHHGGDETMGRTAIGKAQNLAMEEEGWWVDLWLERGQRMVNLVRRLVERGGQLFGSSESVADLVEKADTGEILVWPYWRQTLTTSPANLYSALRPLKAALQDAVVDDNAASTFWDDVVTELRRLGTDLRTSSETGKGGAPAGPTDIELEAIARLDAASVRLRSALTKEVPTA